MSTIVKDTDLLPATVRNGSRLRKVLYGSGRFFKAETGAGLVLGVLVTLSTALVPFVDIGAVAIGHDAWWLLDLVPYSAMVGVVWGGAYVEWQAEEVKRISELVSVVDITLGRQLQEKIEVLNKALPDCGLDSNAIDLLVVQAQTTLQDIGFLAEAILEGRSAGVTYDAESKARLDMAVGILVRVAMSTEELAAARRLVKSEGARLSATSKAGNVADKLDASSQNLAVLGEHIAEVAKAQKELASGQ